VKERIMLVANTQGLSSAAREELDLIISRSRGRPGALLTVLEQVQEARDAKYLEPRTLEYVGRSMGVPLSRLQSVATFYAFFNLEPQGKHTVCVCRGTACHTRGSRELLRTLQESLELRRGAEGEADKLALTTTDGRLTVRTVACIGQCALAPVVEIDRNIHGRMTERRMKRALAELLQEGA
jgi:NADH-quinone oxidoreductase subunit E